MCDIKNAEEYDKAMERLEEIIDMDPERGSLLADEMDSLILAINKYDKNNP